MDSRGRPLVTWIGAMDWLSGWNLLLLVVAAYIAVMTLVRLMRRRHEQLVAEIQQQIDARRQASSDVHGSKSK